MAIKTVGVLGCGLMGAGIAQVSAAAGFKTIVLEVNEDVLKKGLGRIEKFLTDGVAKGKVTEDAKKTTLGNLTGTTNYADLKDCDLVIEAIIENVEIKKQAYAQVEAVVGPHCLIASNTSSLCITELGAGTKRPDKVGGLHFFNPVPLMKLVEVIRALATSAGNARCADGICEGDRQGTDHRARSRRLHRQPPAGAVPARRDSLPRRRAGTAQDIDNGMKLGCGHPMGPFTLLDFVGLDTTYYIANIMFDEFREPRFAPPPLLKRMVLAGHLGKKSGKGFYDYSHESRRRKLRASPRLGRSAQSFVSAADLAAGASHFLEAAIFRRPVGIERRIDAPPGIPSAPRPCDPCRRASRPRKMCEITLFGL